MCHAPPCACPQRHHSITPDNHCPALRSASPSPFPPAPPPPCQAREFYHGFLERLRQEYGVPVRIKDGVFGAMMRVALVNDGPVTIVIDSRQRE